MIQIGPKGIAGGSYSYPPHLVITGLQPSDEARFVQGGDAKVLPGTEPLPALLRKTTAGTYDLILPNGGARLASVKSNTVVLAGHSRMGNNGPTIYTNQVLSNKYGYWNCINSALGGRMRLLANIAISGGNLDDMLNTTLPQLQQMAVKPAMLHLEVGVNDFAIGVLAKDAIAKLAKFVTGIVELGILLVIYTDQGDNIRLNTKAKIQQQVYNAFIRTLPALMDNVVVIDAAAATAGSADDGTEGGMLTAYTVDGVHNSCTGCYAIVREALPTLSALIPAYPQLQQTTGPWAQLLPNPNMQGNNASGTNRFTLGSNATGRGPNDCQVECSGTGTAVSSIVLRSASTLAGAASQKHRAGNMWHVAFTSNAQDDKCTLRFTQQYIGCELRPRQASTQRYIGQRVRPTVPNGVHYAVTGGNGSNTSGAADPTATWPTQVGDTVVDGGVTLTAVPPIDVGDKVRAVVELYMGSLVGSVGAYLQVDFADVASTLINSVYGEFFDATSGGTPADAPGFCVLTTPEFVVPVGTVVMAVSMVLKGKAASSVVIETPMANFQKVEQ